MNLPRLKRLLDHCRQRPGLKHFDFNVIAKSHPCGTAGCLLGEMAYCWPDRFKLVMACSTVPIGALVPIGTDHATIRHYKWETVVERAIRLAAAWFEIDYLDARWLFMPNETYRTHPNLPDSNLKTDSTLEDVLLNLESYIKRHDPAKSPRS